MFRVNKNSLKQNFGKTITLKVFRLFVLSLEINLLKIKVYKKIR